ncbi:hypothetical protein VTJ04DRAFT_4448 [Mycothermus thermophilus]|uniref:uncharacterized protein n=1 Tax=Humicola insolens TaxID=85995 RepID=UPI0037434A46
MSEQPTSSRSSLEPGSTASSPSASPPSSSVSNGAGGEQPPKKRTRASKPKVRTGCITWYVACFSLRLVPAPTHGPSTPTHRPGGSLTSSCSKIRRVKCDEGKPACHRCTSTGRTCDGYDKAALARYQSPGPSQSQAAEMARAEFVRACEWNETLRSMRRIEADIDGTETEKRVFSRFKATTSDGVDAQICCFKSFWRRLTPATACQDEAVKHAVVAMAASYLLSRSPQAPVVEGFSRADLEVFTIQQYNRSIERLQAHATSSSCDSIRITLVCCLAFISLETLRGNPAVAVNHLTNGLRILQSLPEPALSCVDDGSIFAWPSGRDTLDMADIIQLFAQLEASACFFTHGIQPVISERAYRQRRFNNGTADAPYSSLAHARIAMTAFKHDVIARLHEIAMATAADHAQAALFWSDPLQQQQQACLQSRSARLGSLIADFLSPTRFGTPDPTTADLFLLYLDLLHFRCAQLLLSLVTGAAGTPTTTTPPISTRPNNNNSGGSSSFPPIVPTTTAGGAGTLFTPRSVPVPALPYPYTTTTTTTTTRPHVLPVPDPDQSSWQQTILGLAVRLTSPPATSTNPSAPVAPPSLPPTGTATAVLFADMPARVIGPVYLVAVHAAASDTAMQTAAVRLLAECILRSERTLTIAAAATTTTAGGGGGGVVEQHQHQHQLQQQQQPDDMAAMTALMRRRVVQLVERAIQRDCAVAATAAGGMVLSTEMPRALIGMGCVPSLWDVVMGGIGGVRAGMVGSGAGC